MARFFPVRSQCPFDTPGERHFPPSPTFPAPAHSKERYGSGYSFKIATTHLSEALALGLVLIPGQREIPNKSKAERMQRDCCTWRWYEQLIGW